MGLPLKNFVAPQLGEGGADIKCNTPFGTFLYPHDPSLLRGRFWVVKQRPPGFLLWGGTLHEDPKNGWVRVGDNQDPAEY